MSTASTAAGPDAATNGSSTSTAGRLLTTLDSSAATAATPNSASRPVPLGSTSRIAPWRPFSSTAGTTTPRHNTNSRNGASSAAASRRGLVSLRASARAPSTTAPASAANAGDRPSSDVAANPTSVNASTTRTNTGTSTASGTVSRAGSTDSSRAKSQRSNTNSTPTAASHGSAMTAVKWTNDKPATLKANKLVRLDTGNSSDALFARWAVEYACGFAETASVRAVASTTGVNSTTVASRLRIAVVAAAITKTLT